MYYHILSLFPPSSFKENHNNGHVCNLLCLESTSVPVLPLIRTVILPSAAVETEVRGAGELTQERSSLVGELELKL